MKMKTTKPQFRPFPGLRPFHEDESSIFFGREGQSDELLNRLKKTRFLAVVGTSGSGKSSLVRAGLLPSLYGGFMPGKGSHWRIAVFRPGNAPVRNLATALISQARIFDHDEDDDELRIPLTETGMRRSALGLVETIRLARRPKQENLLIVVDQFEELFRFKRAMRGEHPEDEAAAFVKLLLEAANQESYPIFIVLTMRSDFIGDCDQFIHLPEAINQGQYLVPRMTRDQRRKAICGPVAIGRAKISDVLVNRLLNDVGDNPDQLPILQHALMRTWDLWRHEGTRKSPINLDHYLVVGGMERALSNHANEAYDELRNNRKKKIAEKLFKCLTEMGEDNREIRRPTSLQLICEVTEAKEEEVIEVIDIFRQEGRSFLMPPITQELKSDTLIDISHESLIRNWDHLRQWVREEAESAKMYRRVAETTALYRIKEAGLWGDPDLQIALDWQEKDRPNKNWGHRYHPEFEDAMRFLQESKENRDAEAAEKEAASRRELEQAKALAEEQKKRAEEQQRTAVRIRRRARAILVVLLLALAATAYAVYQTGNAKTSAENAVESAKRADSLKNEAVLSARLADNLKDEAVLSAALADSLKNEALISAMRADSLKNEAVISATLADSLKNEAVISAMLADSLKNVAVISAMRANSLKDEANELRESTIAVVLANKALGQMKIFNHELAALLAQQAFLFDDASKKQFKNEAYNAMRLSLNSLEEDAGGPEILSSHSDWVRSIAIHPNQELAASASGDRTIQVKQLTDSTSTPFVLTGHTQAVRAISFSPDGNKLASGGDDQTVRLWRNFNEDNSENEILGEHQGGVWALAFSPQGDVLATGGADSSLMIWNLEKKIVTNILRLSSRIRSLAFSRDGNTLACGGEDSSLVLWNWQDGDRNNILTESAVNTIAFDTAGSKMATGHKDGSVRLWQLSEVELDTVLVGHEGPVNSVDFSPDGEMLASGGSDQSIRLWDLKHIATVPPVVLQDHESWIWAVKFNAKGDRIISGSADRSIRVWTTRPSELFERISKRQLGSISEQVWEKFAGPGLKQKSVQ